MNDLSTRTMLRWGQSLRLYATPGTYVIAACGALSVQEFHDCMDRRGQAALQEGEAHRVVQGGWISIHACSHAEVIVVQSQPAPTLITRSLAGLFAVARVLRDGCRHYAARRSE